MIDNSHLCYDDDDNTVKNQKKSASSLKEHISYFSNLGNKPFHKFMMEYLSECQEYLPHHLKCFVNDNNKITFLSKRPIIRDTDIPSRSLSTKKVTLLIKEQEKAAH